MEGFNNIKTPILCSLNYFNGSLEFFLGLIFHLVAIMGVELFIMQMNFGC